MKGYCNTYRAHFFVCLLFVLAEILPAAPKAANASPAANAAATAHMLIASQADPLIDPVWMVWGAGHYATAEDLSHYYLGGVARMSEWATDFSDKVDYTWLDGVNQQFVTALAVSPNGDRWLGGENGLALLNSAGEWSYFTTANSGLMNNSVTGLAMSTNGALWVYHGLEDGAIERRAADGSWLWFPSRTAAIAQYYTEILTTVQPNPLWTVRGSEIWVGYLVFDGSTWAVHRPAGSDPYPATATAVDSQDRLYTLSGSFLYRWNGQEWDLSVYYGFGFQAISWLTALAVAPDDTVYVAAYLLPYGSTPWLPVHLLRLEGDQLRLLDAFPQNESVSTILTPPGHAPVLVGSNWIGWSRGNDPLFMAQITDLPAGSVDGALRTDAADGIWLFSTAPLNRDLAGLQWIADQATTWLDDDQWERAFAGDGLATIAAFDRALSGDLWFSTFASLPAHPVAAVYGRLFQVHDGNLVSYDFPGIQPGFTTFYAQGLQVLDDHRLLFSYVFSPDITYLRQSGIAIFDNGGTADDTTDDQWNKYPIESQNAPVIPAQDALQRLWYADGSGIYRFDNGVWNQISTLNSTCRLIPGADGAMFALLNGGQCDTINDSVHLILANGEVRTEPLASLVQSDFSLLQAATRYNHQWAIAPDGAFWYLAQDGGDHLALHRTDGVQTTTYTTPLRATAGVSTLEVDRYNHVWIAADRLLWRMSERAQPDFDLTITPNRYLLAPGERMVGAYMIRGRSGFLGAVTLEMQGLPSGLSTTFSTNPISANQTGVITLEADESVASGLYNAQIIAHTDALSHSAPITLTVVLTVDRSYLPLVGR